MISEWQEMLLDWSVTKISYFIFFSFFFQRRQKNKENILAYYSTKIKIQTMVFFNSNTNYLQALKKKNPSLQKKTSSKIPTSLGHISIEYLDDEITVFWAINKKKYILYFNDCFYFFRHALKSNSGLNHYLQNYHKML